MLHGVKHSVKHLKLEVKMNKKRKENWEYIFSFKNAEGEEFAGDTRRLKVWGGWIFNTWSKNYDGHVVSESSCFIPDPEHKWEIK